MMFLPRIASDKRMSARGWIANSDNTGKKINVDVMSLMPADGIAVHTTHKEFGTSCSTGSSFRDYATSQA
jgi:hypothetical protein